MSDKKLVHIPCPLCGDDKTRFERTLDGFQLERCKTCSFVFMNPRNLDEQIAELYAERENPEEIVTLYEKIHTSKVLLGYDFFFDILEKMIPKRGSLLDFGCGGGYFHERALQRGWDAHGIEVGKWAKMATDKRNVPNTHIGKLEEVNFPKGRFDAIFAKGVLEHLPNPQNQLHELYRILRPGGLLLLVVPNYRCLSILIGKDDFLLNKPPQHINYFTPKTMRFLLDQCGYVSIQSFSLGGLKWENILGKPYKSDIVEAYSNKGHHEAIKINHLSSNLKQVLLSGLNLMKKIIYPSVKKVLYDWAKVAMSLNTICRRPDKDG